MAWISRIRALFRREELAREQDEELQFHLSMREQLNVEEGMTEPEARRDAMLRFGNPKLWRERMSEIDLMILPQTVLLDLRYAARMLRRNLGFTVAAVLALAIGIGVNTAAFTAYKAFFKRSIDARESGRMVNLALMLRSGSGDQAVNPQAFFSIPDYEAYRDRLHSFDGLLATSNPQYLTLTGAGGVVSQSSASTRWWEDWGCFRRATTRRLRARFWSRKITFRFSGLGCCAAAPFLPESLQGFLHRHRQ